MSRTKLAGVTDLGFTQGWPASRATRNPLAFSGLRRMIHSTDSCLKAIHRATPISIGFPPCPQCSPWLSVSPNDSVHGGYAKSVVVLGEESRKYPPETVLIGRDAALLSNDLDQGKPSCMRPLAKSACRETLRG